jgi:hypothetical protein
MELKGKLLKKETGWGWGIIEISDDEILAQLSDEERFNLLRKLFKE